jgi:hypothetical protein
MMRTLPSSLLPRSVILWILVLRLCQRTTERPTNHGRERLEKHMDRHRGARSSRGSSISPLRMDGKIGVSHWTWGDLLYQSALTKKVLSTNLRRTRGP